MSGAGSASRRWRADRARYGRHAWLRELSLWAVAVYRFGQWGEEQESRLARMFCSRVYWVAYRPVEALTGVSLDRSTAIEGGLRIFHFGAIVVHPAVQVGRNVTVRQGVTLGERATGGGVPVIGDDVEIGAHAQVLGPVRIGHRAKIGALALVIDDVPDDAIAVAPRARLL